MVSVAQLVVAPGCGLGGRGFKSHRSPHKYQGIAEILQSLFYCAPGRAHLLGGASPLYTRQGEVLAGRQVSEDSEVSIVRCWLKEAAGR